MLLSNYITVYPFPAAQGITQNGDTLTAIQGANSYQWYHDGVLIPGATSYFYVAQSGGDFNVVCTDPNGCEVEAVIFDVLAGIETLNSESPLLLSPIPVHNQLIIHCSLKSDLLKSSDIDIAISNMLGEIILTKNNLHPETGSAMKIDLSSLPAGVYQVALNYSDQSLHNKFIKD